jgi:hypothetical protein
MTIDYKELYKEVVFDGGSVEANGVSICNLENVMRTSVGIPKAKYQVWSDRKRFYGLFYTVDEAVDKFLELRKKQ